MVDGSGVRILLGVMSPNICLKVLSGRVFPAAPVSTLALRPPLTGGLSKYTLSAVYTVGTLVGMAAVCVIDVDGIKSLKVLLSIFVLIGDGILVSFAFGFLFVHSFPCFFWLIPLESTLDSACSGLAQPPLVLRQYCCQWPLEPHAPHNDRYAGYLRGGWCRPQLLQVFVDFLMASTDGGLAVARYLLFRDVSQAWSASYSRPRAGAVVMP